jgi:uncharacterized membrane protein
MEQSPAKAASTPKSLIFIVVCTIAVLSTVFMVTEAYCAIQGVQIAENIQSAFTHAGDILLGALIGLMINTRTTTESTSKL